MSDTGADPAAAGPPLESGPRRRSGGRTRWFVVGGIAVVVVLVAAGFGVWYQFFRDDAPAAVSLEAAVEVVGSSTTAGDSTATSVNPGASDGSAGSEPPTSADPPSTTAGSDAGGARAGLDGTWQVDTTIGSFEDFSSAFVGFRVDEELASLGAKTAVGRTPGVTGSVEIDGATVATANFEADMTQLQSDDSRRDGAIRSQAIETREFPTASFVLTEPIELPEVPAEGETVELTATGDLTIHGVTNPVVFPLEGQLVGDVIVVAGQLPIEFADYGITPPSSFAVLSVEDNGIVEVQLFLAR
jgi:polyisoprenoid-binding protein YceI